LAAYSYTVVNAAFAQPGNNITIIQIKAGSATPLELIRLKVTQTGSTTSGMAGFKILRKSAAATVTSATPGALDSQDRAADAAGGFARRQYRVRC
jgi:hypothetical protein